MQNVKSEYHTIDEYIAICPLSVQPALKKLREVIRSSAPQAVEKISYQMPTFAQNGNLVHFAAHKNHIGFYPTPSAIEKFADELSEYEKSKGAVQFPYNVPLPYDLISRMVRFRVQENLDKAEVKAKSKRK